VHKNAKQKIQQTTQYKHEQRILLQITIPNCALFIFTYRAVTVTMGNGHSVIKKNK